MNDTFEINKEDIDRVFERLTRIADRGGYHLNPDTEFTRELINGLLLNGKRYGYWACPCRLAAGVREEDRDIICPCNYRDPDLLEYDSCYCGLYVSGDVVSGKKEVRPIPERRPPKKARQAKSTAPAPTGGNLPYPVWRCSVCGYLCARDDAPEVCPICKADQDRFELFMIPE
ncbi:ferredoxin-thioredoxin reductase catalytic domain-containing protein [Candidatus Latescibacterota bacterium]